MKSNLRYIKWQQILAISLCGGGAAQGNSISENVHISLGSDRKELPVLVNISHRNGWKNSTFGECKSICNHQEQNIWRVCEHMRKPAGRHLWDPEQPARNSGFENRLPFHESWIDRDCQIYYMTFLICLSLSGFKKLGSSVSCYPVKSFLF